MISITRFLTRCSAARGTLPDETRARLRLLPSSLEAIAGSFPSPFDRERLPGDKGQAPGETGPTVDLVRR
jgi:hypothetical protein